jgi:hypothetical protein
MLVPHVAFGFKGARMKFKRARMKFKRARMKFKGTRLKLNDVRMKFKRVRLKLNDVRMKFKRVRLKLNDVRMKFKRVRMKFNDVRIRFKRVRMKFKGTRLKSSDVSGVSDRDRERRCGRRWAIAKWAEEARQPNPTARQTFPRVTASLGRAKVRAHKSTSVIQLSPCASVSSERRAFASASSR